MFSSDLPLWAEVILGIHFLLLLVLSFFGMHRLSMVVRWFFHRNHVSSADNRFAQLPRITVQIPLYNERMVAQRIVDAVCAFDHPKDRLQIQIVDDSTDETFDLIATRVAEHQQMGLDIQHVHRVDRQGYKAGALKAAMASVSGEFIAVFDADFLPRPSLLRETIDHCADPEVGMVQFRWAHLNRSNSSLTRTQAIMLDAHFALEQQVRSTSGLFLNFNGTAGLWRTATIIDAGHWSADTLTEDLDLSYRAQLRGWKLRYLNDISCPGELPADMNAFKSQQHRWAKGGIQVMLKLLKNVWQSKFSLKHKVESTFHLSNNLAYLVMLIDTIFILVPSLWIRESFHLEQFFWLDVALLMLASGGHIVYLIFGQVALGNSSWKAILSAPRLMLVGIQLAFNNARAACEALLGQQSEFVRTPKSGDFSNDARNLLSHELPGSIAPPFSFQLYHAVAPRGAMLELLLAVVYCVVFMWAVQNKNWFILPFSILLMYGFAEAAWHSFTGQFKLNR